MALSSGWQVAAEIGGGILSTLLGGSFMGNSAASQQDRQFSHNWGLMNEQARLNLVNMAQQNAYNVENYSKRYQLAVNDLRYAGLNPVLAATQGVGGNIQGAAALGAGLGSVGLSQVPDYMSGLSSAIQGALGRKVQQQSLELESRNLDLKESEINSANKLRDNEIKIANARYELDKMVQEASVKRADALNDATIKNMQDKLSAEIEHLKRLDMNSAAMASAAMASANAAGLQAEVARSLGISREAVMDAERVYIGLQSDNASEAVKWQKWLNAHPQTRGAVGFLGAMFDTIGLVKRSVGAAYSGIKSTGIGDDW